MPPIMPATTGRYDQQERFMSYYILSFYNITYIYNIKYI